MASVQYHLAPDFPYPVPLDDVTDALNWLSAHLDEFGATQIAIGGDSAGGNLAAAACIRAVRGDGPKLQSQILIYPALDGTASSPSTRDRASGLSFADLTASFDNYRGEQDAAHPEVSPFLAVDKAGLPYTLVITADHDILRDEGRLYAEALQSAGVEARHIEYPGVDHGFLSVPAMAKEATLSALDEVLRTLDVPDQVRR